MLIIIDIRLLSLLLYCNYKQVSFSAKKRPEKYRVIAPINLMLMNGKTIVTGVIGADAHAVGNKIIAFALEQAGFKVINLGVMVSQEEYIEAAIETNADAILVSSLYGHGEIDCQGLREKCEEAGLKNIPILAGGNLVVGKQNFEDVAKRFEAMGFNKVYPPGTPIEDTIADLKEILHI